MNNHEDETEIDLLRLVKALWKKAWAIALTAALFGTIALTYTAFFVRPLYKAEALMYVNSSNISVGGAKVSISQGEPDCRPEPDQDLLGHSQNPVHPQRGHRKDRRQLYV